MASRNASLLLRAALLAGSGALALSAASTAGAASRQDQQAFDNVYGYLADRYAQEIASGSIYDSIGAGAPAAAPLPVPAPDFGAAPGLPAPDFTGGDALAPLPFPGDLQPPAPTGNASADDAFAGLPDPLEDDGAGDNSSEGLLSGLYFSAYGGAVIPAVPESSTITRSGNSTTYTSTGSTGLAAGATVGTRFNNFRFEVEGGYGQSSQTVDSVSSGFEVAAGDEISTTTIGGNASAAYQLNFGSLGAYAGGSLGYHLVTETTPNDELTAGAVVYGPMAGISYRITENLELAAQYRYLLSGDVEMISDATGASHVRNLNQQQGMLMARYNF